MANSVRILARERNGKLECQVFTTTTNFPASEAGIDIVLNIAGH